MRQMFARNIKRLHGGNGRKKFCANCCYKVKFKKISIFLHFLTENLKQILSLENLGKNKAFLNDFITQKSSDVHPQIIENIRLILEIQP